MNSGAFTALVLNELRLRTRRLSSLVTLLVVVVLTWLVVADPESGRAMMVAGRQRIAYGSMTLAFGTATIAGMLLGLAGFYLARGRTQEDLRCGTAGLLAAAPISNAQLLLARWLGALAYLGALVLALLLSSWVLHGLRGEEPLQPLTYLGTYVAVLLPTLMLAASMAVLCDAWAPLMGKRGDLLYFLLWIAQSAALPIVMENHITELSPLLALDISGLSAEILRMCQLMGLKHFSIGGSSFDAGLPLRPIPDGFWTPGLLALRAGSAVLALLPLLPALLLFHRYSPDRVKGRSKARERSQRLATLWRRALQPLSQGIGRLLPLAARLPPKPGQVLAELLLTLMSQPLAPLLLIALLIGGAVCDAAQLQGWVMGAAAGWGLLISDTSARDHQAGTTALAGALPGGAGGRFLRQWAASLALGLLLCATLLPRLAPGAAASLLCGLVFLSAAASLLGQLTRSGRTFLALFLFGLYVITQARGMAGFDVLGFNGAATPLSSGSYLLLGLAALMAGLWHSRRQPR